AEGLRPEATRFAFMLLMALVIAIAMKIVGILLITSLLVIPAATARRFAAGPELMAVLAAGIGALAVALGLVGSLQYDTPSGPSVVVAALALFLAGLVGVSLAGLATGRRGAGALPPRDAQKGPAR
ncbi:MAG TPA: metal ABC transporter permease, partial [Kiloniellaceae bacterium]|nr:metal ABC transporter permease [Kiloniellaceae bacterium]